VQPDSLGPLGDKRGRALLRPRRHRVLPRARRVPQADGGYRPDVALGPEQHLDRVVIRRDVAVFERPVLHVRAGLRAQQRQSLEVDVPEPWDLCVPVHGATADGHREFVDRSDVAGGFVGFVPKRARVGDRVRLLEVAVQRLEFVVGEGGAEWTGAVQVGEVVRALLEYHYVPAVLGELHCHRRPAGAGADDDRLNDRLPRRPCRPIWRRAVPSFAGGGRWCW